jgi:hypothetical protein
MAILQLRKHKKQLNKSNFNFISKLNILIPADVITSAMRKSHFIETSSYICMADENDSAIVRMK